MSKNYTDLLERLDKRMNPDSVLMQKAIREELQRTPRNSVIKYIKSAMFGVDDTYTKRTIEAGNKVKDNLKSRLQDVSFEFQGSVMTNTHIQGHSDIDLLTITEKFYTFDRDGIHNAVNDPQAYWKYTNQQISTLESVLQGGGYGRGLLDLRELRLESEQVLSNIYSHVDLARPKSIEVSMTQPKRKVDVVIASWYNAADYYLTNDNTNKAVQIFHKGKTAQEDKKLNPDFPFLRIKLLNEKDKLVNGRLKRMIRFLKTIKADANQEIKLSSFDINAICYDIATLKYETLSYLELIPVVYEQLKKLAENDSYRYNLKSLDGREYIFRMENQITEDASKTMFLKVLIKELDELIIELQSSIKLIA